MTSRHKILEITYDWENEKPKVLPKAINKLLFIL